MARKDAQVVPGSALLPTVGKPGSFEWCEEVVECINMAWRSKETAEVAFLAAVRAAIQYRIWETLSPAPPDEPYTTLENLIRRKADAGQAENMQIAIRFSGILEELAAPAPGEARRETNQAALPVGGAAGQPETAQARVAVPPEPAGESPVRQLTEEDEIALGNALLDQYASRLAAMRPDPAVAADAMAAAGLAVGLPDAPAGATSAGPAASAPVSPRRTAAERKRDKLERTHPELAEAVDAGEMTLKQAYIEAGIEKPAPTLDKLQRLWRTASEEERDRFLAWLEEQEGQERREAYEREVYGED